MLFSIRNDDFESEKERNLYYKFFAGYFFNEYVPGLEARLRAFCTFLSECTRGGKAVSREPIMLTTESAHVSFDNHGYLFSGLGTDRGEFADILIHDRSTSVVIPIEAKVHSNWSYEKDITSNERRLRLIEKEMPSVRFYPCLLLAESKWKACTNQKTKEYSNYRELIETNDCRTRVILWEELIDLASDDEVAAYVRGQLARPRDGFGYGFDNGWFVRDRRS